MKTPRPPVSLGFWLFALALVSGAAAQDPGPPPFGPGFGPPGMGGDRKILANYDADKNGRLDRAERQAARAAVRKEREEQEERERDGEMRRPPGPPGAERREPAKRGVRLEPADVKPVAESVSLYDPFVLRTIFLDFESDDWEAELGDFSRTDVEVPATMTVDGKAYAGVGVGFRGASSLFGVGPGYKRSFNVSIDAADGKQRLLGYKSLNLLNSHSDPSFLHSVLVSHVARQYGPAPKVNLVRVVINGDNWGVYANAQQFDRIMVEENFPKPEGGARWKVPGSPQARGGLESFGSDLEEYKRRFQLKSGDHEEKAWKALVNLCKVLDETPPAELEARLEPILDVDGALRFLAVDVVVANGDGYWTRGSDYAMFQDARGRFHLLPHDMNEGFGAGGGPPPFGPGGGRRRGGGPPAAESAPGRDGRRPPMAPPGGMGPRGGPTLDPLVGLDDKRKPLRSKLLAVPALRERYLAYVRDVAATWLDWKRLGPIVAQYRALIEHEVEIDTRKLSSFEAFRQATSDEPPPDSGAESRPGPRGPGMALRTFADQRRKYLLDHPEIRALPAAKPGAESRGAPGRDR